MTVTYAATANPAIQNIGFGSASATFTAASIGAAASDRIVQVNVGGQVGSNAVGVSCTIGGSTATQALQAPNTSDTRICAIFYLLVAAGTTADIVATCTSSLWDKCGITVNTIKGSMATPSTTASRSGDSTNADPQTTSSALTIATGGVGVVAACHDDNTTPTWNVGTQDFLTLLATNWEIMLGHITTVGSQTPSISGYPNAIFPMAAVSWDPAASTTIYQPSVTGMFVLPCRRKDYVKRSRKAGWRKRPSGLFIRAA